MSSPHNNSPLMGGGIGDGNGGLGGLGLPGAVPMKGKDKQSKRDVDKILHAYIYDYLKKRQFTRAAAAFLSEAGDPDYVPIDAPGGFLSEWWSVFWDIFIAMSNQAQATPEALAYVEHQRMLRGRAQGGAAPPPVATSTHPPNAVLPAHMRQHQAAAAAAGYPTPPLATRPVGGSMISPSHTPIGTPELGPNAGRPKTAPPAETSDPLLGAGSIGQPARAGAGSALPPHMQSPMGYDYRMNGTGQPGYPQGGAPTGWIPPASIGRPSNGAPPPASPVLDPQQTQQAQQQSRKTKRNEMAAGYTVVAKKQRTGEQGQLAMRYYAVPANLIGPSAAGTYGGAGGPPPQHPGVKPPYMHNQGGVSPSGTHDTPMEDAEGGGHPTPMEDVAGGTTGQSPKTRAKAKVPARGRKPKTPDQPNTPVLPEAPSPHTPTAAPGFPGRSNTRSTRSAGQLTASKREPPGDGAQHMIVSTPTQEQQLLIDQIIDDYRTISSKQAHHIPQSHMRQHIQQQHYTQKHIQDQIAAQQSRVMDTQKRLGRTLGQPPPGGPVGPDPTAMLTDAMGRAPGGNGNGNGAGVGVPLSVGLPLGMDLAGEADSQAASIDPLNFLNIETKSEDQSQNDAAANALLDTSGGSTDDTSYPFTEVGQCAGHTAKISACDFSSDGRFIASGSNDGKLLIFDATAFTLVHTLEGHNMAITDVRFSPCPGEEMKVISCSVDKTVRLWNAETAEQIACLVGHDNPVLAADFHPTRGDVACSTDQEGTLRLWDCRTQTCTSAIPRGGNKCARFRPNSVDTLATSSENVVSLLNTSTGAVSHTLTGHTTMVNFIAWSVAGDVIATCSTDSVRVWQADTAKLIQTIEIPGTRLNCCVFHPTQKNILLIGTYQQVCIWNYKQRRTVACQAHDNWVACLAVDSVNQRVASASHDCLIKVWK